MLTLTRDFVGTLLQEMKVNGEKFSTTPVFKYNVIQGSNLDILLAQLENQLTTVGI